MAYRVWIFLAGVSALLAVLAGAYGAHALNQAGVPASAVKIYESGQFYQMVHSVAMLGLAALIAATDGRRSGWANWLLQIAGLAFLAGVVMFSGGIYVQILKGVQLGVPVVPAGGIAFLIGWSALALSSFGFRG